MTLVSFSPAPPADSVSQTFTASVWIQMAWFVNKPIGEMDVKTAWKPELTFINISEERSFKSSCKAFESGRGTLMLLTYQVTAKFSVRFDLHSFPIDSQQLRVETTLWRCPYEVIKFDDNNKVGAEGRHDQISCRPPGCHTARSGQLGIRGAQAAVRSHSWRSEPLCSGHDAHALSRARRPALLQHDALRRERHGERRVARDTEGPDVGRRDGREAPGEQRRCGAGRQ